MNTIWIHIEIACNSRTETGIIVRLMMAQYKGPKHVASTLKIQQMLIQ
jgi:hypothetical protein